MSQQSVGFIQFLKSEPLRHSARDAAIWGVIVSPFVAFILQGGFQNPSRVLEEWLYQFWTVIWALPAIGCVWASVLNFGACLLRYFIIPNIPRRWKMPVVSLVCTLSGFAVGVMAMWAIILIVRHGLRLHTVGTGAEWTVAAIVGTLGIIFAHMLYAFYENELRIQEGESRQRQLEQQRLQSELMNVNMRIRPHFFFNALNTLSSLMDKDRECAQQFLVDLADLFRLSFRHGVEGHLTTWLDERKLVELYLDLESRRFADRMAWRIDVDAPDGAPFPAFFLQPLAENAVHHGLSQLKEPGEWVLSGSYSEGQWQISMRNPVPACGPVRIEEGHALDQLCRRAELMGGTLTASCEAKVFTVTANFRVDHGLAVTPLNEAVSAAV